MTRLASRLNDTKDTPGAFPSAESVHRFFRITGGKTTRDWLPSAFRAFHCHLLYHLDAGMFTTIRYV